MKKYSTEKYTPIAAEPAVAYNSAPSGNSIVMRLLEGDFSSKELFSQLLKISGLTIQNLAQSIFEITPKTFIKYKNTEVKLPSRIAELAFELKNLYTLGNEIFGDSEQFNLWLDKENEFFYNKAPRVFLNTSSGINLVYDELKRIEFGALA